MNPAMKENASGGRVPGGLRVLWVGPMQSEREMLRSTAAAPAAMRWTRGFLSGLEANGVRYRHVGNAPARGWPYGPLWVGAASRPGENPAIGVAFLNLPGVRFRHLGEVFERAVARAVDVERPDMVITYNAEPPVARAARIAVARGVPWFPIVMDFNDQLLDASWTPIAEMVEGASGVAFLSAWACEHCPFPNTFLIDGGIADRPVQDRCDGREPAVLYTGTKAPWGGLDLLLKAWRGVRRADARLWICGPGRHEGLRAAAAADSRIVDFGMVSESHLRTLTEQAAVLVNPRPPHHPGNRLNFPSKILEYLGTGKPIVTTRTASFAPEYDAVLTFPENETAAAFGRAIARTLVLSPEQREAHRLAVRRFAARHGDWPELTARFLRWAESCVRPQAQEGRAECPAC